MRIDLFYDKSFFYYMKNEILKNRRCFTIKQELPINRQIKFSSVNVISENGEKLGKLDIEEAIDLAESKDLDLVLVSPNPEMPVAKIMNYGKYKFEQAKCVRKISVQTYFSGSNGLIKKFKVQASNDGSTFIDLTDTIINSNQSDKGESEYAINNSQKYLYYRVYTVESGAFSGWRSIQMYEN